MTRLCVEIWKVVGKWRGLMPYHKRRIKVQISFFYLNSAFCQLEKSFNLDLTLKLILFIHKIYWNQQFNQFWISTNLKEKKQKSQFTWTRFLKHIPAAQPHHDRTCRYEVASQFYPLASNIFFHSWQRLRKYTYMSFILVSNNNKFLKECRKRKGANWQKPLHSDNKDILYS